MISLFTFSHLSCFSIYDFGCQFFNKIQDGFPTFLLFDVIGCIIILYCYLYCVIFFITLQCSTIDTVELTRMNPNTVTVRFYFVSLEICYKYRVDHEFMDGYKAVQIKDQTWQLKKC